MDTIEQEPSVRREYQLASPPKEEDLAKWYEKHGLTPDKDGVFAEMPYGAPPVDRAVILKQVEINAARNDVPNLAPVEYNARTMVYVGGGTTIRDFIAEIKDKCEGDKHDVYTSNATAAWLLSKGIKPDFHLILDPHERKVKDLDYDEQLNLLLGMQCHPALFDRAKEKGAKVWKFLAASVTGEDGKSDRDAARAALTPENPAFLGIGGGSMCGTRMIYFAAAMGYRTIEFYGVDGSVEIRENNVMRAYAYNKPRGEHILETETSDGRKFHTTMSLARQGEELVMLRDRLPGLNVIFYGDSLMAHQNRLYEEQRKPRVERWTPEHAARWQAAPPELFESDRKYDPAPRVWLCAAQLTKKYSKCEVLDYGCGSGALKRAIRETFPGVNALWIMEYDPFVKGKSSEPHQADVVYVGNVMQYVEPECVDAVLAHIKSLTRRVAIFQIHVNTDNQIVQRFDWWKSMLQKHFVLVEKSLDGPTDFVFVAQPVARAE